MAPRAAPEFVQLSAAADDHISAPGQVSRGRPPMLPLPQRSGHNVERSPQRGDNARRDPDSCDPGPSRSARAASDPLLSPGQNRSEVCASIANAGMPCRWVVSAGFSVKARISACGSRARISSMAADMMAASPRLPKPHGLSKATADGSVEAKLVPEFKFKRSLAGLLVRRRL